MSRTCCAAQTRRHLNHILLQYKGAADSAIGSIMAGNRNLRPRPSTSTHLPRLELLGDMRGYALLTKRMHNPSALKALKVGTANAYHWTSPYELDLCDGRPKQIRHVLQQYKAVAASDGPSVMAGNRQKEMQTFDVDEELTEIMAGMPPNTSSALGLPAFTLTDLDNMATITGDDLRGWVVYVGWIQYVDGRVKCYIGSSAAKAGSGSRSIHNYETCMRYASMGRFHYAFGA